MKFNPPKNHLDEIRQIHSLIKNDVVKRLLEFSEIWKRGTEDAIFCELVFCLLTPQSSARRCDSALKKLNQQNLVFGGCLEDISCVLNIVRFKNKKAQYIVLARDFFTVDGKISIKKFIDPKGNVFEKREWLVKNIKGIGYKEASHFLRNIGFGKTISILDRHILKNLKLLHVITDIPSSITKGEYLKIEERMKLFAEFIEIPLDHLDFVLWYREAGEVFK
jgi:N-glycosylase/DNA lyase